MVGGEGGLLNRGARCISRWAYIRNNIFFVKWMGLYLGGLKPGSFKVGFYGIESQGPHSHILMMLGGGGGV